jgi:hypothetical protein
MTTTEQINQYQRLYTAESESPGITGFDLDFLMGLLQKLYKDIAETNQALYAQGYKKRKLVMSKI